jgi:hypothetical protein
MSNKVAVVQSSYIASISSTSPAPRGSLSFAIMPIDPITIAGGVVAPILHLQDTLTSEVHAINTVPYNPASEVDFVDAANTIMIDNQTKIETKYQHRDRARDIIASVKGTGVTGLTLDLDNSSYDYDTDTSSMHFHIKDLLGNIVATHHAIYNPGNEYDLHTSLNTKLTEQQNLLLPYLPDAQTKVPDVNNVSFGSLWTSGSTYWNADIPILSKTVQLNSAVLPSDSFNNSSLSSYWNTDELGDASVSETTNLQFTFGSATTSFWTNWIYHNVGFSTFDVCLKVDTTGMGTNSNGRIGILYYQDGTHYQYAYIQYISSHWYICSGYHYGGAFSGPNTSYVSAVTGPVIYIRYINDGTTIYPYYSQDGISWQISSQTTYAFTYTDKVGIFACNSAGLTANVEYFGPTSKVPLGRTATISASHIATISSPNITAILDPYLAIVDDSNILISSDSDLDCSTFVTAEVQSSRLEIVSDNIDASIP